MKISMELLCYLMASSLSGSGDKKVMCTSSNNYNYNGRNLDLRLIKATTEELVKELFTINNELDSIMHPVSGARAAELNKRKDLIFNELHRRELE